METEEKQYVGYREYSRIIGCDIVIISRAVQSGKIPAEAIRIDERNNRPQINKQMAEEAWGLHYRESRRKNKNRKAACENSPVQAENIDESTKVEASQAVQSVETEGMIGVSMPKDVSKASYLEADRLGKIADLEMKQLKLEELRGTLVKVDAIEKVFFDFSRTIRNGFQNIADRVIDQILSSPSRNEAHIFLQAEIDQVLQSLSNVPEYRAQ